MLHSGEYLGQQSLLLDICHTGLAWPCSQSSSNSTGKEEGDSKYDHQDDLEDHLNDGCCL